MAAIDICLATFNGAQWLPEFLASLDRQIFGDWRLIVSDDGSSDGTLDVLRSHFQSAPEKIMVVQRAHFRTGVILNFQDALAASTADYIFLADQDDVWLPHKLGDLLAAIRSAEAHGQEPKLPVLAYSDMQVVNDEGVLLDGSWWNYGKVSPYWVHALHHLLPQNGVPGCAMAVNRRLLQLALPVPKEGPMHDWWLLLVGLVTGRLVYVPEPGVQYRRHQNAATYRRHDWKGWLRRFQSQRRSVRGLFSSTVEQARNLLSRPGLISSPEQFATVSSYVRAADAGWWLRRYILLRLRVRKANFLSTLSFYLWV